MATSIHPTAIVEKGAELGSDVEIGPFAYVGHGVRLGEGTRLHHHASVEGHTVLGAGCELFPYCSIGAKTQDLKYKGGRPGLRVGDRNVFREYVSVHAATNDGEFTVLGSHNTILAYSHIAHDCQLGSHIVMSNAVSMAGHVQVEDHVIIGGAAGIHQFCRLGAYAMLSAMAKLVQDLPPWFIADGTPAVVRAINKIGLERNGFTPEQMERVKQIHRIFFRSGLNRTQAVEKLTTHADVATPEFRQMLEFTAKSERGLAPGGS